jgi:hypothetical protein
MSVDLLEMPAVPELARPPRTQWLVDQLRERLGGLPRRWGKGWSLWWNRPWTNERIAQLFTAIVVVGLSTFAVVQVVHLDLVFAGNTPTGGDFGAHVMGPAYLRDHLLPQGKITGWTNGWYAGTPMYRFYMVVPALLIVLLNVFMPYGVAMKVVSVLGVLTLPVCCWLFGRLARFRWPMPELFALAGMIFLFDESFSIYGGNMKSTMAGEFSFSIALSLAVLGLGLFARSLETGQYKGWSAVVLALAMLSHGIVLIFVAVGMVLMWLLWVDKTRFFHGIAVGGTALLLSAFWVLPFVFNHDYMTDMKYEPRPKASNDSFWYMFFPWPSVFDFIVTSLAVVGFVACVVRRHLNGAWLGIVCLALTSLVFVTKDHELPFLGLLWNPRLLPFLYLLRLMLMMVGIVELVRLGVRGWYGMRGVSEGVHLVSGIVTAAVVMVVVMVIELFVFEKMPGGHYANKNGQRTYSWGIGGWDIVSLSPKKNDANSDGWTAYNFSGYENRPHYNEYRELVLTMKGIGEDPEHGCGRAIWENNDDVGPYGTTMALMLLPHWTNECIASMEGLYFEASGTTPFHFVTSAAVSSEGSKPVREQRYDDSDIVRGVSYMRALGVNYLMVHSQVAKDQAAGSDDLTLIAESGPWQVYEVSGSELVEPLRVQPVVVLPRDSDHRSGDQRERHLELGMSWFRYREDWMAMPADGGPNTWQRIHVDPVIELREYEADSEPGDIKLRYVDVVRPRETIDPVPLPEVNVSAVDLQNESLRFDVDRAGVPVVVKLSYFPNWKATGAEGPYRIGPNMMVVVPTSTTVTLSFERSTLDNVAYALTLLGVLCLVAMWLYGPTRHRSPYPALLRFDGDDHGDDDRQQAARQRVMAPDATVPIPRLHREDPFDDSFEDPFGDPFGEPGEDRLATRPVSLDDRYDIP